MNSPVSATRPHTIAALQARISELRKEIARHPLSQELAILVETVERLRQIPEEAGSAALASSPPLPFGSLPRDAEVPGTILGAAEALVSQAREPIPTRDLLSMLPRFRVYVGGKEPARNLSSILSKRSDRLCSVPWKGTMGWWLKSRPVPHESTREAAE